MDSQYRFFETFCSKIETKRWFKILTVLPKCPCFRQMGRFGSENAPSYFINGLTSSFEFWNLNMHEFFFWVNGLFRAWKWHVVTTLDPQYGLFKKRVHNERGLEVHEHYITQYQPPSPFLLGGTNFSPKFWKGEHHENKSIWVDLKSSCHGYLPGGSYYVSCQIKDFWK